MAERALSISFATMAQQEEQNASIDAELDAAYNNNRTSFSYGEKVYYRIYTYPILATITQTPSDGIITVEGSGYRTIEDIITFPNTNESNVSYPVNNIISSTWWGNDLGAISADGKTITASQSGVGVLKLSYRTYFRRYGVSVPTRSEAVYGILIYIVTT